MRIEDYKKKLSEAEKELDSLADNPDIDNIEEWVRKKSILANRIDMLTYRIKTANKVRY